MKYNIAYNHVISQFLNKCAERLIVLWATGCPFGDDACDVGRLNGDSIAAKLN